MTRQTVLLVLLAAVMVIAGLYQYSLTSPQSDSSDRAGTKEATVTDKVEKTDKEWKDQLTPEQYRITREKGTEIAFTGKYNDFKGDGVFRCVCCGAPLFDSDTKYESGSGWPSFYQPIDSGMVGERSDGSLGMLRTEVICKRCGAHLGHVFEDGPQPTGLRYCINSAALDFQPEGQEPNSSEADTAAKSGQEKE